MYTFLGYYNTSVEWNEVHQTISKLIFKDVVLMVVKQTRNVKYSLDKSY